MFRRSFGVFAALAVLGLSAISLGATYGGGSGTPRDPYQIWTAEQLNTIGANSADWGGCFALMADIDMSVYTGTQYKIIGNSTTRFTGIFDGNRHVIRNLTYSTNDAVNYVGLFGYTYNAAIKNLGLENATISSGGLLVGCLVGLHEGGSITNCYTAGSAASISSGTSSVYSIAGGLAGSLFNATMTHCCSTASVLCSSYTNSANSSASCVAGGLVGRLSQSSITSSFSTGSITADSASPYQPTIHYQSTINCGGLVGVSNSSTIMNCYSTGWITAPSSHSTLTSNIGGLAGVANEGTISGSFWDMETSGLNVGLGHGSSTGLTGKTTAEMQTLSTFVSSGWDFSAEDGDGPDWYMSAGSYPQLKWMMPVIVPDVAGLSMSDTPSVLNPIGLFVSSLSTIYNSSIPEGTIISQTPAAGQIVLNGTGLNLVISLGAGMAGTGTVQDPYQIWTAEQMYSVGLSIAKWSKNFILMADIDMSAYSGNLYQPIGNTIGFNKNPFSGTFDGNGHIIRNLNISNASSVVNYTGIFGYTQGATIKNLHLENIHIFSGSRFVGGLVGNQVSGSVSNCSSTGSITATITTNDYIFNIIVIAGGLIGHNENGTIANCYSTCSVASSISLVSSPARDFNSFAGGLVGYHAGGTILNCFAWGSVASSCPVSVFSSSSAGGLVGCCYSLNDPKIENCYSTGFVSATGYDVYKGGLLGRVVGTIETITACFWDIQTSGLTTSAGGSGIQGKTTAEMQTLSTFTDAGWDFSVTDGDIEDWILSPMPGYPKLAWQTSVGMNELNLLSRYWQMNGCIAGQPCFDADWYADGVIDILDLEILSESWLSYFIEKYYPSLTYWSMDEIEGDAVADTSSLYHGQLINMDSNACWTSGYINNALLLDGIDDYVEVPGFTGITGTNSRTCAAWIKATANGKEQAILSWGNAASGQKWMFRVQADGKLAAAVWGGYIQGSASVADGQWHHVAAVLADDGSPSVDEIRLYVDGVSQIVTYSSPQAIDTAVGQDVQMGSVYNGTAQGSFFSGLIDEVRIYDVALTGNQILRVAME